MMKKGRDKLKTRLKEFEPAQIEQAILNFSNNAWQMENNARRGVAWFFHTEERVQQYIDLAAKKGTEDAATDWKPTTPLWSQGTVKWKPD